MIGHQHAWFLAEENRRFAGTGGISRNNVHARFYSAFRDTHSGQIEISRFQDDRPAPLYLTDGLPEDWITKRDSTGRVLAIKETIVSGFVRFGVFFTRQEASDWMSRVDP